MATLKKTHIIGTWMWQHPNGSLWSIKRQRFEWPGPGIQYQLMDANEKTVLVEDRLEDIRDYLDEIEREAKNGND